MAKNENPKGLDGERVLSGPKNRKKNGQIQKVKVVQLDLILSPERVVKVRKE